MNKYFLIGCLLAGSLVQSAWAAAPVAIKTETEHINYSIGYQMGTDFKNQGWELSPEAMVQGIKDAVSGNSPLISEEQMKITLAKMKRQLIAAQHQTMIDYQKASREFVKENAKKEGVVVLPSGVQYKVLREGTGKTPTLDDVIRVHYKTTKVDGVEVSSTYSNSDPRVVPLNTALPGLQEVLLLMKTGSKYQIVLPIGQTAPNNGEQDDSGAKIYEMELISIKPKA